MTLNDIIKIADEAYGPDGCVLAYHQDPEGEHGDTLAEFIAIELRENFYESVSDDEPVSDAEQMDEAARVMVSALRQLAAVAAAFENR